VPFFRPCTAVAGALACLEPDLVDAGYGSSVVQELSVGSQSGSTIPSSASA
jgi:hypothetical protein